MEQLTAKQIGEDDIIGDVRCTLLTAGDRAYHHRYEEAADIIHGVISRLRDIEKALRRACEEGGE